MEAEKSALNETGPAPMQAACITFNIKKGEENRFPLGKFRETLRILEDIGLEVTHVESREPLQGTGFGFYIGCKEPSKGTDIVKRLGKLCDNVNVKSLTESIPWFPRTIRDLDKTATNVLELNSQVNSDHPGFNDKKYLERRKYFADLANNYKYGDPLPRVEYTEEEIQTWSTLYKKLMELYPTHACKEFNDALPDIQRECGYREDNIPQLDDVSKFLKKRTGFIIRPIAGYLSPRDFLAGFAFRVFHATQYIRHWSSPMYTPEPDVCHELLGHAPLLSNPDFAQFTQEVGLASLGVPDEYIDQLTSLYLFIIEFGLCKEDGKTKAFGAGLLSSFGELQYSLTDEPEVKPLDLPTASKTGFPITEYQPLYFMAKSISDSTERLIEFARSIPRPFTLSYDAFTNSVVVINDKESVCREMQELKAKVDHIQNAIDKLQCH